MGGIHSKLGLTAILAVALVGALWAGPAAAAKPDGPSCKPHQLGAVAGEPVVTEMQCGVLRGKLRIRTRPEHGSLRRSGQDRKQVRYRADTGYEGADAFVLTRRRDGRNVAQRFDVTVSDEVGEDFDCDRVDPAGEVQTVRYATPSQITVRCPGGANLPPIEITTQPAHGSLSALTASVSGGYRFLTATYTPTAPFAGQDSVGIDDGGVPGTLPITVEPWQMRAIGDSVTAGFGYFGDGKLMPVDDLLDCKPPDAVNNRCSSNSSDGPGYTGPPAWSPDFGLANDIAWPAQFANDWQGGGHIEGTTMFQNRAVTGSAPSDWLPGGELYKTAQEIIAEDPQLIVFTLGANPLLTDLLLTTEGEECAATFTVAELQDCIEPFFESVDLQGNLQKVYTELLAAPDSELIAFQYNLSIPAANLFSTWQLETMIDFFNLQITKAVANTKAALPASQANRLTLVDAQTDPASPSPTELPRFDIGVQPTFHNSWSGVYDCGWDDYVDGPSHQSDPTQDELEGTNPGTFCEGEPWIIEADSGIHPNQAGYAQYAATLANVVTQKNLIPPLP